MKVRYTIASPENGPIKASGTLNPDGAQALANVFREVVRDFFDFSERDSESGLEGKFLVHLESFLPKPEDLSRRTLKEVGQRQGGKPSAPKFN